jgi:hypothetical protein
MSNTQIIKEFVEKYPYVVKPKFGESVVFLRLHSDGSITMHEGVVWQIWEDGTFTVVTDDSYQNVHQNHLRVITD